MDFLYKPPFGIDVIKQIIPHRYPFLLVDGITEFTEDSVSGYKLLTSNEGVFEGHFPGQPVYPGVLQVETMAQTGACWILSLPQNHGKIAYLLKMEEAKFRRMAIPGQRLDVFGKITNMRERTGRLEAKITCDGNVISECILFFAFQKEESRKTEA